MLGGTRVGEEKNTETRIGTESGLGDTRVGEEKNTDRDEDRYRKCAGRDEGR